MTLDDTISTLLESARENGLPKGVTDKLVADLRKAAQDEKAARVPAKRQKTQHAILVSDPEGRLKGMELVGWVVAMEEDAPPQAAYHRILAAVNLFNGSKRGRKAPLETLGDAMEVLRGRFLKQEREGQKVQIKTRTPVALQAVANALPKD